MEKDLESDDSNSEIKEQITLLLKQKEILVQEITINKKEKDRYRITLYIEKNEKEDINNSIINILTKILGEKVIIQNQKEIKKENVVQYEIISDDKYILDIGHSIAIKDNMSVSGDSILWMWKTRRRCRRHCPD